MLPDAIQGMRPAPDWRRSGGRQKQEEKGENLGESQHLWTSRAPSTTHLAQKCGSMEEGRPIANSIYARLRGDVEMRG